MEDHLGKVFTLALCLILADVFLTWYYSGPCLSMHGFEAWISILQMLFEITLS